MDGSGARAPERRPSWREENQADWRAEARVSCAAKRCWLWFLVFFYQTTPLSLQSLVKAVRASKSCQKSWQLAADLKSPCYVIQRKHALQFHTNEQETSFWWQYFRKVNLAKAEREKVFKVRNGTLRPSSGIWAIMKRESKTQFEREVWSKVVISWLQVNDFDWKLLLLFVCQRYAIRYTYKFHTFLHFNLIASKCCWPTMPLGS